ncbi:hybrid sensor histidine kinase/response regulator [Massilia sp. PWRC2]|uniref:hybrid sensor histidine kinase/response regulator n=1 Tax=Massilia sp. PWRC2 TaxID=2804626 RepID=UPI003CFAB764
MFRSVSLTLRQLLFLLTSLGLLPIAVIGAWGIHAAVARQQADLSHSIQALARALASAVDAELDTTLQSVRVLAASHALATGDVAGFYGVARTAINSQSDWRGVILTDSSGKVLFRTSEPLGTANQSINDIDSLRLAMSSLRPVVGGIARGPGGRAAVPIRVPVVADGRLQYVVTVALAPDRMLGILRNQKVPSEWLVSVADAHGLRVARTRDQDSTVATRVSDNLGRLMQRGALEATGVTTNADGVEMLTTYSTVPKHGWAVAIGAPTARFRDVLWATLGAYAVAIALALSLYIALVAAIARRLVASIDHLREQTARLGRKLQPQMLPSRVREVNEIGHSLLRAAHELDEGERQREALVASLTDALVSAEKAAATKDNFLAVLGHELRNPLAPIVMALDLMDIRAGNECRRERDTMRRQVNHMRRLVDDLLDVSRITQGKLTMSHEPVNLSQALRQAIDAVRPAMDSANRSFVESIDEVWVVGDETRLVQVAINLLANALRYGGTANVTVELVRRDGNAVLAVIDSGVGMEPDTAALIFQPFYQAPQPLARSSGGLGLGLTIVLSIVELLQGSVRACSAGLGQGSRFEVVLPAVARPAPAHPAPVDAPVPSGRRIMIVDDNIDAVHTAAELLALMGHQVRTASDGKGAMALLQRMQPDIVILDIGLPDIDGFELGRSVRRHGFRGTMLALTGYGQESDRHKALAAGFDQHLSKPVDVAELQRAIGAAHRRDRAAAERMDAWP